MGDLLFPLFLFMIPKFGRIDYFYYLCSTSKYTAFRINKCYGSETIVIGAQQYTQKNGKGKANVFANAIKHDFKSKNPTTRWSDIIPLKWKSGVIITESLRLSKYLIKNGIFFVFRSIWINFSRSRMQIYLYSLRLIEILHYLCKVAHQRKLIGYVQTSIRYNARDAASDFGDIRASRHYQHEAGRKCAISSVA